jgi:hypothetical protein
LIDGYFFPALCIGEAKEEAKEEVAPAKRCAKKVKLKVTEGP